MSLAAINAVVVMMGVDVVVAAIAPLLPGKTPIPLATIGTVVDTYQHRHNRREDLVQPTALCRMFPGARPLRTVVSRRQNFACDADNTSRCTDKLVEDALLAS